MNKKDLIAIGGSVLLYLIVGTPLMLILKLGFVSMSILGFVLGIIGTNITYRIMDKRGPHE